MNRIVNLSADEARRLILHSQMLFDNPETGTGKDRTSRIIENLGYVQIDTISVVQRAHHHTLWTRYSGYHPDMLHQLQAVDRKKAVLILRNLQFEEGFDEWEEFLPAFAGKLADFARFNNCAAIELEDVKPRKIASTLRKLLKTTLLENRDA